MSRTITVELTEAEANALYLLADNSSTTREDAAAVLYSPSSVNAGYRALEKLRNAVRSVPRKGGQK